MMVLVVGDYGTEHAESIGSAIRRAFGRDTSQKVLFVPDVSSTKAIIGDPEVNDIKCIFIDRATTDVEEFVAWLRGQDRFFSVPVFAVVPNICDQAFRETNAFGVDDTLGNRDMGAFTRRVAVLSAFNATVRPPIIQGNVVIAHSDRQQRRLFGKTMRNAGFNLVFASDQIELKRSFQIVPTPRIVICDCALSNQNPVEKIEQFRATVSDSQLPFVLLAKESSLRDLASNPLPLEAVEYMSETAPPDNLLFLTNELLRREAIREKPDQRASERLLYGTLCAFRHAGDLSSVYGYCYNISYEGMYVKTFDPPRKNSEIWLEMRPPGEITGIHLRGKVIWVRPPDNSKPVAVPPGFGLRIDSAACPPGDLEKYRVSYEQLLENQRLYYPIAI